ncbi:hypothetical protein M441DRAFT_452314 [Trichoderma asperellum CBS 433.97]|uniref:Uncharacterized protein n=1 Tax=Trichoderma asperellum (strain ATCC 204424 / CBS 433.97 / NBRC 101777) TaxID=1042311 RepID=A0A2T3YSB3_TRIA4|nr:hypothetical protein M441DRAFT_452314 [Trichoderma asperellum CBS 433.97]PTB35460.1 hypothetical protein M441DRAFT_452314 [Trichoderma asperellum CBS 433.97]
MPLFLCLCSHCYSPPPPQTTPEKRPRSMAISDGIRPVPIPARQVPPTPVYRPDQPKIQVLHIARISSKPLPVGTRMELSRARIDHFSGALCVSRDPHQPSSWTLPTSILMQPAIWVAGTRSGRTALRLLVSGTGLRIEYWCRRCALTQPRGYQTSPSLPARVQPSAP